MTEYEKMKKPELQALLRARRLPVSGNKDVLIERLKDNDNPQAHSPLRPDREDQNHLLEGVLEALKCCDPREVAKSVRQLVHAKHLRKAVKMLEKDLANRRGYSNPWRMIMKGERIKAGKCLEPTCPLCGTGTLCESLDRLCGASSKCTDRSCNDLENCSNCRGQIQELEDAYTQRKREDCADGSCGDLFKCLQCENRIQSAMVPLDTPGRFDGPLDPWISGDATHLRYLVSSIRTLVHSEYLTRLLRKLQDEKPDPGEWTDIKQKLKAGKCLASTCSLCSTGTMSESLDALSHGFKTDCGSEGTVKCSAIFTCSSCRQAAQNMEDTLSRFLNGSCKSGHCDSTECSECRKRLAADSSSESSHQDDEDSDSEHEGKYCLEDDCEGVKTCMLCQYEKIMEKVKRAEEALDDKRMRRFDQLGHCVGPDPNGPDSDLFPYGLGCRFLGCERCRMIEANTGPKMRNDELRRRRVEKIKTSLTESSDGTMTGVSRKWRFSNLDLHFTLQPENPLAKRMREEKQREKRERERACSQHERPSWFGTPEDPLPDLWMGRPILAEKEIRVLKVMDSQPKFYLSQMEESIIILAKGEKEKRFSTIIRRLEAELMSRDFWMQSLGFESDDGFGNIPAGDYRLVDPQSTSAQESGRVESWVADLPRF
ncbi:hypothetical protein KCU77_g10299, partial [Aureobasidium melanogenum]